MKYLLIGFIIGFLTSSALIVGAQFYPGMDPDQQQFQWQRMDQQQQELRQRQEQQLNNQRWQQPC